VTRPFDLLVVGGGTAGLVGAYTGAALGARVAIVERDRLGGDCLWTGCVPSKALLASAHAAADARRAARLGVHVSGVEVDFEAVRAHIKRAIATIEPVDGAPALEAAGVTVLAGAARFTGTRAVTVEGVDVPWRRLLLATGSEPVVPDVDGLHHLRVVTTDDVWDLEALPDPLVVLGGGPTGCELAQAFARLGARVTLVELAPRVLAGEDPDAAALVHDALVADGVEVLAGHRLVRGLPGAVAVREGSGTTEREIPCGVLLVAAGRRARSAGLGLDAAGVRLDAAGQVVVDPTLRTTNPRIWAAGDVTPLPRFTHTAGVFAGVAATNAVLRLRRRVRLDAVPRVAYTDPEVAAVGVRTDDPSVRVLTRSHHEVDRAIAEGRTEGFARLAVRRRGGRSRLVGATVVGPRAGETLAELTLSVRLGLGPGALVATTHPYPAYTDGPVNAAVDDLRALAARPLPRTALRLLAGVLRVVSP
jgi:pyruvate/2-oxoglutarate dehydrogenase complex dihydrolipoamide dehydrogenase (E3) component